MLAAYATPPTYHCSNRVFEWMTSLSLLGIAFWLMVFPRGLADNAFRHVYDVVDHGWVLAYLMLVGSFRCMALYWNGRSPKWGPKIRAVGAWAGALVWLQLAAALIANCIYHNIDPSISVLVYTGLALAELKSTQRARSDANGPV